MASDYLSKSNSTWRMDRKRSPKLGVYIGEIVDNRDVNRTGRIRVYIAALDPDADATNTSGLFDCLWSSPFAGSTDPSSLGDRLTKSGATEQLRSYLHTQHSYGMWMVPPDPGNLVLVAFGDGNMKYPVIISCLFGDRMNHMVPGMPGSERNFGDAGLQMPVAEKNRLDVERTTHNDAFRPVHVDIAEGIVKQGLINDPVRGAGSSGARRESPSEVFGFLTPGPRKGPGVDYNVRLGGHQFVMDDNLESRLVRLRTAGGAQLLMNDTEGVVYVINQAGTAWVELTKGGDIKIFSNQNIDMRARGNFNLRADQDVNIEAGHNVNIRAAGDTDASGEYAGSAGKGDDPQGQGGNLNLEAQADLNQLASGGVKVTAAQRDLDLFAQGGVKLEASSGAVGITSSGATDINAGGAIGMDAGGAFAVKSGSNTAIRAPKIMLNSGGPSPGSASSPNQADSIPVSEKSDQPSGSPEFDRAAAEAGESGVIDQGERQGDPAQISTIVTGMPTAEPYFGHNQLDPLIITAPTPSIDPAFVFQEDRQDTSNTPNGLTISGGG